MTEATEREEIGPPNPRWLTRGVLGVGGASLCSDAGHEMATSLLPTLLTSSLHAGPAALGTIDGISDALSSVAKLAGGSLATDRARRPRIASGGYLGTALATALIGVATALWQVAFLRAFAWVSRGLRSPARDMILTDLAGRGAYGRAFGVERAGDNAGAIIGPLAAAGLVGVLGVRHTILLAIVPGALAALAITVAAREVRQVMTQTRAKATLRLNLRALHRAGIARLLSHAQCPWRCAVCRQGQGPEEARHLLYPALSPADPAAAHDRRNGDDGIRHHPYRGGGVAAGSQSDQALHAALQRVAARRQELPLYLDHRGSPGAADHQASGWPQPPRRPSSPCMPRRASMPSRPSRT